MNTLNQSNTLQLNNEGLLAYSSRLERIWNRKVFFEVFINGIQDQDVKRRTERWFKEHGNTKIFKNFVEQRGYNHRSLVIKVAEAFQKEKDEDDKINLPDFKTEDINRYFETEEESYLIDYDFVYESETETESEMEVESEMDGEAEEAESETNGESEFEAGSETNGEAEKEEEDAFWYQNFEWLEEKEEAEAE